MQRGAWQSWHGGKAAKGILQRFFELGYPRAVLEVSSLQMVDAGLGIGLQNEEGSFGGQAILKQGIESGAKGLRLS